MQNEKYRNKLEEMLNTHFHNEMKSFYLYHYLSTQADSTKLASKGLNCYFKRQYHEELKHAQGVCMYMCSIDLTTKYAKIDLIEGFDRIKKPEDFLKIALENEKKEYEHILSVYKFASENNDPATTLFLDNYVCEQVRSLKEIKDMLGYLEMGNKDLNCALFDCKLCKEEKRQKAEL